MGAPRGPSGVNSASTADLDELLADALVGPDDAGERIVQIISATGWAWAAIEPDAPWRHVAVVAFAVVADGAGARRVVAVLPWPGAFAELDELVHRDTLECACLSTPEDEIQHWGGPAR